jgi:hypothetical protein
MGESDDDDAEVPNETGNGNSVKMSFSQNDVVKNFKFTEERLVINPRHDSPNLVNNNKIYQTALFR